MRRLLLCILMMSLLSACGMCSKKEAPPTDEGTIPAPVATTSPAAANACDELKCGSEQASPTKGTAPSSVTPPPAPTQGPAPGAASASSTPSPSVSSVATPTAVSSGVAPISAPTPKLTSADAGQQLRLSRDPFRRYVGGSISGRYPELSNLPVSSFRYVGIVKNEDENLALLEDHTGNGHTVRVGTRVGKEGGQVSEISEQEVVVKTTSKDSSGRLTTKYFRLPFYVRM